MTLAEYAELYFQNEDLFATHAMNYVTMLFAYIIAAHFVGPVLSKVQASIISLLYTMFLVGPINDVLTSAQARQLIGDKIRSISPEDFEILQPTLYAPGNTYYLLTLNIGGWAMSLYYMWHVRSKNVGRGVQ